MHRWVQPKIVFSSWYKAVQQVRFSNNIPSLISLNNESLQKILYSQGLPLEGTREELENRLLSHTWSKESITELKSHMLAEFKDCIDKHMETIVSDVTPIYITFSESDIEKKVQKLLTTLRQDMIGQAQTILDSKFQLPNNPTLSEILEAVQHVKILADRVREEIGDEDDDDDEDDDEEDVLDDIVVDELAKPFWKRRKPKSNEIKPRPIEELIRLRKESLSVKDWEDLGIGGLNEEVKNLLQETLISRTLTTKQLDDLGLHHSKGIILYGPPGNGKTTIARSLASMLHSPNVKVVNGSEMDSMWLGETQRNVNALFDQARKDWKKYGNNSELHVVIFDEIDSFAKTRRDMNPEPAIHTLLSVLDGVEQMGNLLVFGITNRYESLDPALIRHGRLGTHIYIGPPSLKGRLSILRVHTQKLRSTGRLDDSVDLMKLAMATASFNGASIKTLVQRAMYLAIKENTEQVQDYNIDNLKVHLRHFNKALELTKNDLNTSVN